ncbi:hypothetical protein [Kocuria aegyptia]|uniref:Aminoglycoside phosphotransferase domain-containing protein n=1 Tax=Kocuria aegyptia TaxID=330943 RepID=A0ABN2KGR3_9MICC
MAAAKQNPMGSAGPGEALLTAMVSASWDRPVRIASWEVEKVDYPFASPATAGLFRVRGTTGENQPWSLFAKVLQHPRHWAGIDQVPAELREDFEAAFPWRGELVAWEPAFVAALPPGLRVPFLHRVVDLGADRLVLWMEDVDIDPGPWDPPRFARAGHLLGGLAARRCDCRALAASGVPAGLGLRRYVKGRVLPMLQVLQRDEFWAHPLVAAVVDARLRRDLAELAGRLPAVLDRLDRCPQSLPHGDASPQNLLPVRNEPGTLVVIDTAFQCPQAIGFDLGQLLIGLVHAGELSAASLESDDAQIMAAFARGLAEGGVDVPAAEVVYGHHGSLLARAGFTAFPLEHLGDPPTPTLEELFAQRAALTRYIADSALALQP